MSLEDSREERMVVIHPVNPAASTRTLLSALDIIFPFYNLRQEPSRYFVASTAGRDKNNCFQFDVVDVLANFEIIFVHKYSNEDNFLNFSQSGDHFGLYVCS